SPVHPSLDRPLPHSLVQSYPVHQAGATSSHRHRQNPVPVSTPAVEKTASPAIECCQKSSVLSKTIPHLNVVFCPKSRAWPQSHPQMARQIDIAKNPASHTYGSTHELHPTGRKTARMAQPSVLASSIAYG